MRLQLFWLRTHGTLKAYRVRDVLTHLRGRGLHMSGMEYKGYVG